MRFSESARLVDAARAWVPGGVSSNFRLGIPPTPLVFESASGPYLFDVDGNRLIDYFLGMGPMLLGHSPQSVIRAATEQLSKSILVAGQTELEYEAAQLLIDIVPSAESVRFCSSGSEADQAAVRLARAVTGRSTVLKFEGQYHGWFDSLLWSVSPELDAVGSSDSPTPVPGSLGQMPVDGVEVMRWNDAAVLTARLASRDVAAVIMEPMMLNSAGILALPGYLEAVRAACDATGTLLIFDEVITGFRVSAGGVQALTGVTPDLTVLGKALANGFAVAAVVGRADLMDYFGDRRVLHGGTYNTQSVSMAATVATLSDIKKGDVYATIDKTGTRLIAGLQAAFADSGLDATLVGFPSVFHVRFGAPEARDYREAMEADRALYGRFALALLERGVRVLPRGTWFLSEAHSTADVDETLAAVRDALTAVHA